MYLSIANFSGHEIKIVVVVVNPRTNQISEEYNSHGVVAFQSRLELSYLDIE